MQLGLNDKVILVTGGGRGIGAAVIRACAQEGALPVILDREKSAIEELQTELAELNIRSEAIVAELTDFAGSCRAIENLGRKHGHIDGLVNNAGINDGVGLEYGNPQQFANSLNCNLVHYYTTAQAVLPFMKQGQGAIVNISSKVAIVGQGGTSGYTAAKGEIMELTTDWSDELSAYNIRVNAVVPAEVKTPQYESWLQKFDDPPKKLKEISARIPLGHRMTEPDEIAAMVVFLLSARSGGVTGRHFYVDGGYVHLDRSLKYE
jgi:L-fucose dehydrogenase